MTQNEFTQTKSANTIRNSQFLRLDDTEFLEIWTINFDLDTKNPNFKNKHYTTIHNFLAENGFTYRQHSGDISTRKMDSEEVITILDDLYATYPQIKACTKSCLFTSVDKDYSFTDVRKEQLKTTPKTSQFTLTLDIAESDIKPIFKATSTERLDQKIRKLFKYPPDLKDKMSCDTIKSKAGSVTMQWGSDIPISSLDKTIATNHLFLEYPKLLDGQSNLTLKMNYDGHTTDLIAEQHRIESEEGRRLVEYDMTTKIHGKKEYDKLNNKLKRQFARSGLKHTQESGWISENGMTDEQIQAILTEPFRENPHYDDIAEVVDVSAVSNKTYDYMELRRESATASGENDDQDTPVPKNVNSQLPSSLEPAPVPKSTDSQSAPSPSPQSKPVSNYDKMMAKLAKQQEDDAQESLQSDDEIEF